VAVVVKAARSAEEIDAVRDIFRAMAKWYLDDHNVNIEFQGFSNEVNDLPGVYSPLSGDLHLAFDENALAIGAIAIRKFDDQSGDVKRLCSA